MEASKLKNMVILKNLPSNLIEEAIVILKSNTKVKDLQKIENNKKIEKSKKNKREDDYVLKEAEMIITRYITRIEKEKTQKEEKARIANKKCRRLKNYAYLSSFIIFLQAIILIVK